MSDVRRNEIIVIVGKKGCGKSTRAREILEGWTKRIIVDPQREHRHLGVVVHSFDELANYIRPLRHGRFSVVYWGLSHQWDDLMSILALPTAGTPEDPPLPGTVLFIDEVDKITSSTSIPAPLHKAVNDGRHYQLSLILTARRPRRMHADIRANMDRLLIGTTYEPADIDYFREFIGDELAERAKAIGARVEGERPTFIEWEG